MQQLLEFINTSKLNRVLIIPHISPDGDTIGSAIALMHLLSSKKIKGYIVLNDDVPSNLSFLTQKVVKDQFIKSENVNFDYDAVFTVDCAEQKLFNDRLSLLKNDIPLINIDHHFTNQKYGDINVVDIEASSTGELIYRIYEKLAVEPNSLAAEAIYAAIVTDTGSFRYSNTRPYTFEVCAKLQAIGFEFNALNVALFQNKSYEKLNVLNQIFKTLERFYDGKFAIVKLTNDLKVALGYDTFDTDGVVEYIRDITGVEVVAFLKESDGGVVKGSLRSKFEFDVSVIAQNFGGGGHVKAAGFTTDLSIDHVKDVMVAMVKDKI